MQICEPQNGKISLSTDTHHPHTRTHGKKNLVSRTYNEFIQSNKEKDKLVNNGQETRTDISRISTWLIHEKVI